MTCYSRSMSEQREDSIDVAAEAAYDAWRADWNVTWSELRDDVCEQWRDVARAVAKIVTAKPQPIRTAPYEMTDEQFAEFLAAFDAAAIRRRFREGSVPQ